MHENASWVFSVLSWKTDSGLKKGKFQLCFSRASRREPHNLRDRKVGSEKQIIAYNFLLLEDGYKFLDDRSIHAQFSKLIS